MPYKCGQGKGLLFIFNRCERYSGDPLTGRFSGLSSIVFVKVLFSFAGENVAGRDEWPGRKVKRTGVELNRDEAFGYAF
jgi:hypothetical protein